MFIPVLKESYRSILREYQSNDRNFNVLEAVELVSTFNHNILSMPKIKDMFTFEDDFVNNYDQAFIPTRYTTIPFPNIKSDQGDESGLNRTSPFFPINPLKGHPIKQDARFQERKIRTPGLLNVKWSPYTKSRRFHTLVKPEGSVFESQSFADMKSKYLNWRLKNSDLKI